MGVVWAAPRLRAGRSGPGASAGMTVVSRMVTAAVAAPPGTGAAIGPSPRSLLSLAGPEGGAKRGAGTGQQPRPAPPRALRLRRRRRRGAPWRPVPRRHPRARRLQPRPAAQVRAGPRSGRAELPASPGGNSDRNAQQLWRLHSCTGALRFPKRSSLTRSVMKIETLLLALESTR